mmetsp:Transcript_11537/g.33176  ORF Transcript_11537/g.33176 Transcript_11537/m.33176 type:complete len:831 (-) Transcript_11537:66-2558(-)
MSRESARRSQRQQPQPSTAHPVKPLEAQQSERSTAHTAETSMYTSFTSRESATSFDCESSRELSSGCPNENVASRTPADQRNNDAAAAAATSKTTKNEMNNGSSPSKFPPSKSVAKSAKQANHTPVKPNKPKEQEAPKPKKGKDVAPKRASSKFVQTMRNNAGSTIVAANFISNCWSSAWKDRSKWKDRLAPLEALHAFLKTTGIDKEALSQSASFHDRNKLFTNMRILAHCQKIIAPTLRHRIEKVRAQRSTHSIFTCTETLQHFMKYSTAVYGKSMIQAARVESGKSVIWWTASKTEVEAIAKHIGLAVENIALLHDPQRRGKSKRKSKRKTALLKQESKEEATSKEFLTSTSSATATLVDKSLLPEDVPLPGSDDSSNQEQKSSNSSMAEAAEDDGKTNDTASDPNKLTLRHLVAIDHDHKAVVLCIRGTYSLQELLVDLGGFTKPFCGGEGHSEIIAMVESLWEASGKALVQQLNAHPDYNLVLTGHSLGASSAALLNLWLQSILVTKNMPAAKSDEEDNVDTYMEEKMCIPPLRPSLPTHMTSSKIKCFAFAGLPVYCRSSNIDDDNDNESSRGNGAESNSTAIFHATLASILKENSVNVMHRYDYAPFFSIDRLRRILYDVRAVDDYYEGLADKVRAQDKNVGLKFHTKRWWTRQQVAKGRSSALPPTDLISIVRDEVEVPPKVGAPTLWMPTGKVLWIREEASDANHEDANANHDDDDDDDDDDDSNNSESYPDMIAFGDSFSGLQFQTGNFTSTNEDAQQQQQGEKEEEIVKPRVYGTHIATICDPVQVTSQLGIYLHHQMFMDHLPSRYETALAHTTSIQL